MVLASQTVTDTIGYIAIIPLAYLLIPQIILTYKIKHTEGVSVTIFYMEMIIGVLNIIYGVLIEQYPIIIGNAIVLVLSSILLYMYYTYPKHKPIISPSTSVQSLTWDDSHV